MCRDGKTEREVCRRVHAGVNARRAVEGVMADRRISKRLKGKLMNTRVTPLCQRNGNLGNDRTTTTKAASVRKQLVQKIARVTRADRRRMVALREETGVQRSLTEILVRNSQRWAGQVERMADDRLQKRVAELREEDRRRRGRPRMRWEDCDKRDVKKAGEEEDWTKKTGVWHRGLNLKLLKDHPG